MINHLKISDLLEESYFPLSVTTMSSNWDENNFHDHDFSELVYIASGEVIHKSLKAETKLTAGTFFFIHPGVLHNYINPSQDLFLYNVIFKADIPLPLLAMSNVYLVKYLYPEELKSQDANDLDFFSIREELRPKIESILREINQESMTQKQWRTLLVSSMFIELIVLLSRECANVYKEESLWTLDRAVAYMKCHFSENIKLSHIAQKSGMSIKTLQRHFKSSFGVTPSNYLMSIRLQHAIYMLKNTNSTLEAIATECGFSDSSHLWRTLKQKMSISPSEVRKKA